MANRGSEADPVVNRDQAPSSIVNNGAVSAAAAAPSTVVADTGQLPAGTYEVEVTCAVLGPLTAGVGLVVEHRDAANTGNVAVLGGTAGTLERRIKRVTVAVNQRIRVRVDAVALPASVVAVAAVRAYLLP